MRNSLAVASTGDVHRGGMWLPHHPSPRRVAREGLREVTTGSLIERELWSLSEGPGARTEDKEEEVRGVRSRGAGLRPQRSLGFYSEKGNLWRV